MDHFLHPLLSSLAAGILLFVFLPSTGAAQEADDEKDAPYVPTPQKVVVRMLEAADVSEGDVVIDLGSGDGRIPITAARKFGARGIGIEIDPELIAKARAKAKAAGVSHRVEFRQGDLFEADLRDATVVALYLWPEMNLKLRPKLLRELDPGDRVVSHDFRMGEWEPHREIAVGEGNTGMETVYLWTIPKEVPEELMQIPPDVSQQDVPEGTESTIGPTFPNADDPL